MNDADYEVGDRITFVPTSHDPVEISTHRHAIVTAVHEPADPMGWPTYEVGHAGMVRRYGPFSSDQLVRGWDVP
ncbi:hypothetical protein [Actinoplanes sp. NPDC049316]|uniref:hypothetical protein n=1 Tax=Actinoplanes sp. NPDC049316 TaxID=3154727 RepID=UPI00342D00CA